MRRQTWKAIRNPTVTTSALFTILKFPLIHLLHPNLRWVQQNTDFHRMITITLRRRFRHSLLLTLCSQKSIHLNYFRQLLALVTHTTCCYHSACRTCTQFFASIYFLGKHCTLWGVQHARYTHSKTTPKHLNNTNFSHQINLSLKWTTAIAVLF